MKATIKLILIAVLFSSIVIADEGNMGNGGRTCTPPTTGCPAANDPVETTDEDGADSVFEYIREYIASIFE